MPQTCVGFNWFSFTKSSYLITTGPQKLTVQRHVTDFKFDNSIVLVTQWVFTTNESPVASVSKGKSIILLETLSVYRSWR